MAVSDHDDPSGASAYGFDNTTIFDLAGHSVIESILADAKRYSEGKVATGGYAAGVGNLEVAPRQVQWATTPGHHYAGSESPVRLYQSQIGGLMSVSPSLHAPTAISRDVNDALIGKVRISDHA